MVGIFSGSVTIPGSSAPTLQKAEGGWEWGLGGGGGGGGERHTEFSVFAADPLTHLPSYYLPTLIKLYIYIHPHIHMDIYTNYVHVGLYAHTIGYLPTYLPIYLHLFLQIGL